MRPSHLFPLRAYAPWVHIARKVLLMLKIVINPRYAHLKEFITAIATGQVVYDAVLQKEKHLVVRLAAPEGYPLVVKLFSIHTWPMRIALSGPKRSKPRKSFESSRLLEEYGIAAADPVAYVESYRYGLYRTGYYIARFIDAPTLASADTWPRDQRKAILRELARFTADLHAKNIRHGDYSKRNILFHQRNGQYSFSLVDTGSIRLHPLSRKDCAEALAPLLFPFIQEEISEFVSLYSTLRGWSPDELWKELRIVNAKYEARDAARARPRWGKRLRNFARRLLRIHESPPSWEDLALENPAPAAKDPPHGPDTA